MTTYIKPMGAPDAPHQFSKPLPVSALHPEAQPPGQQLTLTTAQTEEIHLSGEFKGERKGKK